MSNAGIGLRIIQEISGHSNLEQLQRYARGEAGSSQRSVSLSFHAFLHGES
jgi:site-specific recombinase XerD